MSEDTVSASKLRWSSPESSASAPLNLPRNLYSTVRNGLIIVSTKRTISLVIRIVCYLGDPRMTVIPAAANRTRNSLSFVSTVHDRPGCDRMCGSWRSVNSCRVTAKDTIIGESRELEVFGTFLKLDRRFLKYHVFWEMTGFQGSLYA